MVSVLKFYKFAAYITGIFLLLLCLEMGFKYSALQWEFVVGGFNVSTAVLVAHGWLYVLYLVASFRLWVLMRWELSKLFLLALGGVIPFLSFFMEKRVQRMASLKL